MFRIVAIALIIVFSVGHVFAMTPARFGNELDGPAINLTASYHADEVAGIVGAGAEGANSDATGCLNHSGHFHCTAHCFHSLPQASTFSQLKPGMPLPASQLSNVVALISELLRPPIR